MAFEGWFTRRQAEAVPESEAARIDRINADPDLLDTVKQIKLSRLASDMPLEAAMVDRAAEPLNLTYDETVALIDRLEVGEASVSLPEA